MVTFLGVFRHGVDEKLRIAIPARFRDQLAKWGQSILYTVARKDHIVLFPEEAWERFVNRLVREDVPADRALDHDYLRRQVALNGEICRLDAQGRISLRADQLEAAGIKKDATIFGNVRVLELWSGEAFERMASDTRAQNKEDMFMQIMQTL
ncbi:MAG: hypothetical protein GF355_07110 [Candidatus Eisenbacteria bacterium]|nr:hypothetical protein [Candidatus Eisenbacteria bacterium]